MSLRDELQLSRDALDGHLLCLAEHRDEWEESAFGEGRLRESMLARRLVIDGLLAVLRESPDV